MFLGGKDDLEKKIQIRQISYFIARTADQPDATFSKKS